MSIRESNAQKHAEEWDMQVITLDGTTLHFPKCDPVSTVRDLSVKVATCFSTHVNEDDIRMVLYETILEPDETLKGAGLYHKAPGLRAVVQRDWNIPPLCCSSSPGESPRLPMSSSSSSSDESTRLPGSDGESELIDIYLVTRLHGLRGSQFG